MTPSPFAAASHSSLKRRLVVAVSCCVAVLGIFFVVRSAQPRQDAPTPLEYSMAFESLLSRREMPVGEFLTTALFSDASWTLGPGFLHPEEDGTWMAQVSAGVNFSVSSGETPVSVELDLEPLVAAGNRERRIRVSSSVDSVDVVLRGGRARVMVAVDGEADQEVTIACDALDSPIGLQLGPDRRAFCAKLHGYVINGDG